MTVLDAPVRSSKIEIIAPEPTALSIDQILHVQGLAIRHGNKTMLYAAWSALGISPTAPVSDCQRAAGCDSCASALALEARLARAIAENDIAMIYRCRAALRGDPEAIASYLAVAEMELAMRPVAGRVRP